PPARLKVEAVVAGQRLERGLRPGAEMLDHLGRGERAESRRSAIVGAAREPDQKSRREQIARSGGVDHALDRARRTGVGLLAAHDQAALLAARDDRELGVVA